MLQKQAQPELALKCAEKAINLDPKLTSAHLRKSSVLWAQRRRDDSIAAFMKLIALEPRYAEELFISQLGLTEKEVAILQQVRAAATAAHPEPAPNLQPFADGNPPPLQ
jgi:tetratricopeptide (TPR) repeat protein